MKGTDDIEVIPTNLEFDPQDILFKEGIWVVGGGSWSPHRKELPNLAYSRDLLSWEPVDLKQEIIHHLRLIEGSCFAVGNAGLLARSGDGINWKEIELPVRGSLSDIAFGNGLYVIVGWHGKVCTSRDLVTWEEHSLGNYDFRSIAHANGRFVAVGRKGCAFESIDGKKWQPIHLKTEVDFVDIDAVGSRFYAVGAKGTILRL